MGRVLATAHSNTALGARYEILVGDDGVIYCKCRGWVATKSRPRVCTHIKDLIDDVLSGRLGEEGWGIQQALEDAGLIDGA